MRRAAIMANASTDFHDVLIVGAGHAGAHCAAALRQFGLTGTIGLVSDEAHLPYERPPLSKDYLGGAKAFEQMGLQPASFWRDRNIALLGGRSVTSVDAARHVVTCADGGTLAYGKLVWAAGGRARRLSCAGADLRGLHVIRTRDDVDGLKAELDEARRVVVIGGGFIGLEAAAALRKQGKDVSVVEAFERVLARVTGETLSAFMQDQHRARGVEICLGAKVEALSGEAGRVKRVELHDGRSLPADLVIVGIGIEPCVEPLRAAGIGGPAGVDVDAQCRTALDDVYAIGDCARHANAFAGRAALRIESVQNAVDQATLVAGDIVGRPMPKAAPPWFWSTQYDIRIQMAGLSGGHDKAVVRGDPASGSFSVAYLRDGALIAIDCVNATKDFVQGRSALAKGLRPDCAALADASVPLSSLS
ncbi:Ferredoxin--NAD(P)(+) reductase fdr [Paraburkholderia unamae]|nr:Ferredoxin--NAD(P)(+) reductase fdr [Paraburkholderia unamae]